MNKKLYKIASRYVDRTKTIKKDGSAKYKQKFELDWAIALAHFEGYKRKELIEMVRYCKQIK